MGYDDDKQADQALKEKIEQDIRNHENSPAYLVDLEEKALAEADADRKPRPTKPRVEPLIDTKDL